MALCPMTFNIPAKNLIPGNTICVQENCAWWNAECGKCSDCVIADSLRKQVKK